MSKNSLVASKESKQIYALVTEFQHEIDKLKAERDKAFAKIRGLRGVFDRLYLLDDITDTSLLPQIEKLETELAAAKMEIECEERRFNALTDLLHEVSTRADKAEAERDAIIEQLGIILLHTREATAEEVVQAARNVVEDNKVLRQIHRKELGKAMDGYY